MVHDVTEPMMINMRSPGPTCCGAVYLCLSAGDLTSTSSHICGS